MSSTIGLYIAIFDDGGDYILELLGDLEKKNIINKSKTNYKHNKKVIQSKQDVVGRELQVIELDGCGDTCKKGTFINMELFDIFSTDFFKHIAIVHGPLQALINSFDPIR
ncbi:conserved hypothetical protein [Coccidioides posadasii str. Silveira]|uniref:Uncharacterized protein n=2 Tax=Coccidioides posadasii TaxID=199306 RepID=E9D7E8_COCPS|nr:conserved hypothetical protein [Coccidioides posadasii str. Silveira]KMM71050.1 hypothetical protein CPAG_07357 [Coccidioides posadasii RMSCC 3488]